MVARGLRPLVLLVCLAAVIVGLRLGHAGHLLRSPNSRPTVPISFSYWDRAPISEHLGLAFTETDAPERRRAYQHHSPLWMGLMYAWLQPLRAAGVPYDVAQNALVLIPFAALLGLLWASLGTLAPATRDEWLTLPALLLAAATVATSPSLWLATLVGNPEEHGRLTMAVAMTFLATLDFHGRPLGRAGLAVLLAVVLLAPMPALLIVGVLLMLGIRLDAERPHHGVRWDGWARQAPVLAATAVVMIALPYAMLRVGHWTGVGSSVPFRSGLDGDTQYFSSIAQAVLQPIDAASRPWRFLPLPLAAMATALGARAVSSSFGARVGRLLLVSWSPALVWLVLFPQMVSIHPYLFDFGVLLPPAFCLLFCLAQPELRQWLAARRAMLLAVTIGLAALLMTNLLDLARVR